MSHRSHLNHQYYGHSRPIITMDFPDEFRDSVVLDHPEEPQEHSHTELTHTNSSPALLPPMSPVRPAAPLDLLTIQSAGQQFHRSTPSPRSHRNSEGDPLADFAVTSLTFRDFFPKLLEEGTTFGNPVYENFGVLVARANDWLHSHREFEVLNVECFEILAPHNSKTVDPSRASYFETHKDWTEFVRGLRMWLIPATSAGGTDGGSGGFLRYFDVVPECTHAGIVSIEYTRLSGLVEALNDKLRHHPINGDILAVQTLTLRFHFNEAVDTNVTCFSLHGQKQKIRLYFLRVFYMEYGDPAGKLECLEEIGVADFVPQIYRDSKLSRQQIEPLGSVVTRAGDWFIRYQEEDRPGLRIVNIQTVCLHVKDSKKPDTQQTFFMTLGDGERFLYELRFIRLIYARQTTPGPQDLHAFPRVFMKLFCPNQLAGGGSDSVSKRQPQFTGVQDMVGKIQEWMGTDRPPIIGLETHGYSSYVGDEYLITAEIPYIFDQGHEDKFWVQSIRVYYEGEYVDSSQELPLNRARRGSSIHGKRPLEGRHSGSGTPSGQQGSLLSPDTAYGQDTSTSPRIERRRSTAGEIRREELARSLRDTSPRTEVGDNPKEDNRQSDKDCVIC